MSNTQSATSYNANAIAVAQRLETVRQQVQSRKATNKPTLDHLFPDFNRVPVGVLKEYERMGNQPLSTSLETLALDQGVTFEHLATTIGTVIHGLDLKDPLTPEQILLIRSTLLERKVVFFREQFLSEDQQVNFAHHFGELDAFPGDGVHAFMFSGIAMATSGECVDVGVGGDQTRRGHFPCKRELDI